MCAAASYLRALRERHGLSRATLASQVEATENTIWRIEDGRQEPSGPLLVALVTSVHGNWDHINGVFADTPACDETEAYDRRYRTNSQMNLTYGAVDGVA